MADPKRFAARMRILGATVETNATKLMKKVATRVDQVVVTETPVDTGRARSNWQAEIGNAAEGTVEPVSAEAALARNQLKIDGAKAGDEIHLTNNLSYIGKLNEGHSAQAPAGYVEEAVLTAIGSIKGDKITVEGGVKS